MVTFDDGISIPAPKRRVIRITAAKMAAFELGERELRRAKLIELAEDFAGAAMLGLIFWAMMMLAGILQMEVPV